MEYPLSLKSLQIYVHNYHKHIVNIDCNIYTNLKYIEYYDKYYNMTQKSYLYLYNAKCLHTLKLESINLHRNNKKDNSPFYIENIMFKNVAYYKGICSQLSSMFMDFGYYSDYKKFIIDAKNIQYLKILKYVYTPSVKNEYDINDKKQIKYSNKTKYSRYFTF